MNAVNPKNFDFRMRIEDIVCAQDATDRAASADMGDISISTKDQCEERGENAKK